MSNYITTHNSKGEAVFSDRVPTDQTQLPLPMGRWTIFSTTHSYPPSVDEEGDIDQYAHDSKKGLDAGVTTSNGTAAAILELDPGAESPMHRTMTLDIVVIIEGVIELHLDSGEKRVLRAGDTVTQRATMHKWINVTPDNGRVRMVGFAQPIKEPLEIAGQRLQTHFPSA